MDNTGYIALTRQSGLLKEMQLVANNIANVSTAGFRKEGLIFSEYVLPLENGDPSVSMAYGNVRVTYQNQGAITQTGNQFDLAIEGNAFFSVETPTGEKLTRAGNFSPNGDGELSTPEGYRLLDVGGAPIFIAPDSQKVSISADGTLSVDGDPVAQVGLFQPVSPRDLQHQSGVLFSTESGLEPAEGSSILQGFLEDSNVSPVVEIARMIEVQRSYELGQTLLDREDERIRNVLQTLVE